MKAGVLAKRLERRTEAKEEGEEAKETGTVEELDKLSRRTVKVTKEHNEECRKLLTLMGIPWVVAPSEAEAQCAELCRGGLVYGAGSEDMDTLTFGSPVLLRHLTFSEARKLPIHTVNLEKVLTGLELTMDQFIEFCILCGCDYVDPLRGIAAKTALKLIKEFDTLENVINHLRDKESSKASSSSAKSIPDDWPWEEAKELFKKPDVLKADEVKLEWKKPDLDGLIEFLVKQKGFEEERIKKGVMKLESGFNKKQQSRLDGFFVKDNQNNAEDNSKKSNKNKKTSGKDSNNKKRKLDNKQK
uniref:Flap endonuclease 1 n=1 Tax=Phakopsora pachyrhizi TaxID=170000 RepID=A0A0S1MIP5_PHAPC